MEVMTRRPKGKGPQPGKRRHPRRQVSLWAQIDGTLRHPILNLSEGGLFLLTEEPLAIGRELALELPLPNRTVRAAGRVVHATATEDFSGNGIVITKIAPDDTDAIRIYLADDATSAA